MFVESGEEPNVGVGRHRVLQRCDVGVGCSSPHLATLVAKVRGDQLGAGLGERCQLQWRAERLRRGLPHEGGREHVVGNRANQESSEHAGSLGAPRHGV